MHEQIFKCHSEVRFVSFFSNVKSKMFCLIFQNGIDSFVFYLLDGENVLFHFLENSRGRVNDFWIAGCKCVLFHFLENSKIDDSFHFSELSIYAFCFIFQLCGEMQSTSQVNRAFLWKMRFVSFFEDTLMICFICVDAVRKEQSSFLSYIQLAKRRFYSCSYSR